MSGIGERLKNFLDRGKDKERDRDRDSIAPSPSIVSESDKVQLLYVTIFLEIWRLGPGQEVEEGYEMSITRFLWGTQESLDHPELVQSYSYQKFKEQFEAEANRCYPGARLLIEDGELFYQDREYNQRRVLNQHHFEAAISHMFNMRRRSDTFFFTFMTKANDALAGTTTASALEQHIEEEGRARPSTPRNLSPDSRPVATPVAAPESPSKSPLKDALKGAGDAIVRRLSNASRASDTQSLRPPLRRSHDEALEEESLRGRVSGVKEPENKSKRLKDLAKESERISYQKAGDGEDEDGSETVAPVTEGAVQEITDDPENSEEKHSERDDVTISQEDHVGAELQALLKLKELTQLGGETYIEEREGKPHPEISTRWEECCRLFGMDSKNTKLGALVEIAGLKKKIYQYQAFGVYWQMINSRQVGGGFYADDMGLGKTLSFLAYTVVERQLSVLWTEVGKSRAACDGKHLQPSQQSDTADCPTLRRSDWIICPCTKTGPTYCMQPQPGLRLACVPTQLVGSWYNEWKTYVDGGNGSLGLNLVVEHPPFFRNNALKESDLQHDAATGRNQLRMRASVNIKSKDGKQNDEPTPNQDGWLVLTTKEDYPQLIRRFEGRHAIVRDPKKPGEWKKGTRIELVFGIAMSDESHEEYFKGHGRAKTLGDLPRNSSITPFIWGYSGTPFSQTPRGLEGVLSAIEKHAGMTEAGIPGGWQSNDELKNFQWEHLDKICKDYDVQVKTKESDEQALAQILARFKPFLLKFMIRRTADTKWFGHILTKLKPHLHQDIMLPPLEQGGKAFLNKIDVLEVSFQAEKDEQLLQLVEKWNNNPGTRRTAAAPTELPYNTWCRTYWRSRLISSFPYLTKFMASATNLTQNQLTLTEAELRGILPGPDGKGEKASPYSKSINIICENSPKCVWLYNFISQLDDGIKKEEDEKKLVILTEFPQAAYILRLFIKRYFPEKKDRVAMITGKMPLKDRNAIVDAFNDAKDDNGKRKTKANFQFLIGCTRYVGVGLNLTRASQMVLFEPDYDFGRQFQGYSRVHRIGQKAEMSRSFRLIQELSDVEDRIVKRQRAREETFGKLISREEADEMVTKYQQ